MEPEVGASRPTARLSSVRLAGAVGPDQADDPPAGDRQRAVGEGVPTAVRLAEPFGLEDGGHATPASPEARNVSRKRASMLSSSSPARRALCSQRFRSARSGPCAASEPSLNVRVTNVPTPGRAAMRPVVLELAVGLQHRVRVDGEMGDDVLHRRELVTLVQQPEAQGLLHLLDDLQVRRDARAGVEMEVDHAKLDSSSGLDE